MPSADFCRPVRTGRSVLSPRCCEQVVAAAAEQFFYQDYGRYLSEKLAALAGSVGDQLLTDYAHTVVSNRNRHSDWMMRMSIL